MTSMRLPSRLHVILAGAALVLSACPAAPGPAQVEADRQTLDICTVAYVIDGDTLECEDAWRIRLIGIDAPELDQAPFGAAARAALERLAPRGAQLRVTTDVERIDRFGRTLAYLYSSDGTFINEAMARNGFAVDLTIRPNVAHSDAIRRAVAAARAAGAGLWTKGGFDCTPAAHRNAYC